MKIWFGYGSEHSMNLVMLGRFKSVGDAAKAKEVIDRLTAQVDVEVAAGRIHVGDPTKRFPDEVLALLRDLEVYVLAPGELEQFAYSVSLTLAGNELSVTTDESDVSAFLKIMIENGARVEVYSAHDYPDAGHGRGG